LDETRSKKFTPASIGASLLGFAFARYAGMNFVIPLAGALLIGWLLKRGRARAHPMAIPIAVQGGHLVWFVVGALVTGAWSSIALDMVIFSIGIAWLFLRPGLPPVIVLGAYQALSLIVNVMAFAEVPIDSSTAKALAVHAVMRGVAIGAMVWCLRASRKAASVPVEPSPTP
jgi:hypothetical protein